VTLAPTLPWSSIALGCEALGGADWGAVDPKQLGAAVRCALERGIAVFDTADVYGLGRSERELSRALGADRYHVTVVTKGGVRWDEGRGRARTWKDASPRYLASALEASLTRLRLDAVPVYLVHWPDPATPLGETLDFLERARCEGKVVAYGLSNHSPDGLRAALDTHPVSVLEEEVSLLSGDGVLERLADVRQKGLCTLAYGVLAQGLLSGKYPPGARFDHTDRRHRLDLFSGDAFHRNRHLLAALDDIAREIGATPAQVAIRWVSALGAASAVIVGAKTPEQVHENWTSASIRLTDSHLERLGRARQAAGLVDPHDPKHGASA